ncbi:MAG: arginine--tRNA ligase, partial [Rickettsiales bacterium]
RQHLHFEQVFRAATKVGYAGKARLEHIGYGTVNGKDGKPFKTREGGVMRLEDLIEMCVSAVRTEEGNAALAETIGIAALKFADLSGNIASGYVFDVEKFVSTEGKTGPYLQYACVRVQSMLQKTEIEPGAIEVGVPEERDLAMVSARFPQAMHEAVLAREPSVISEYAYELAQSFSKFYAACPIAKASNPTIAASRMGLSKLVHGQLAVCLDVLGIQVPEKM